MCTLMMAICDFLVSVLGHYIVTPQSDDPEGVSRPIGNFSELLALIYIVYFA